jgi:hypothetical protein
MLRLTAGFLVGMLEIAMLLKREGCGAVIFIIPLCP